MTASGQRASLKESFLSASAHATRDDFFAPSKTEEATVEALALSIAHSSHVETDRPYAGVMDNHTLARFVVTEKDRQDSCGSDAPSGGKVTCMSTRVDTYEDSSLANVGLTY